MIGRLYLTASALRAKEIEGICVQVVNKEQKFSRFPAGSRKTLGYGLPAAAGRKN